MILHPSLKTFLDIIGKGVRCKRDNRQVVGRMPRLPYHPSGGEAIATRHLDIHQHELVITPFGGLLYHLSSLNPVSRQIERMTKIAYKRGDKFLVDRVILDDQDFALGAFPVRRF